MGLLLGLVETPADDIIDLRKDDNSGLRQEFVDFYQKDTFAACGYCAPQTDPTEPAVQLQGLSTSIR
jgi:hypothetical protein